MRPSRTKIAEVIAGRLNKGDKPERISKEVAAYLLESGRSSELESIMRDVMAIRAEDGHVESSLTTAHDLTINNQKDIKSLIKTIRPKARSIQLDQTTDPKLIGGFKLQVISQSLDLSIRAKLNKLKQLSAQGGL